jgi:hypothetical protein
MFYGMMRAVLLPRSDPDLLIGRTEDGRALTREEWLRLKFSADIVFLHRAQEYHLFRSPILRRSRHFSS